MVLCDDLREILRLGRVRFVAAAAQRNGVGGSRRGGRGVGRVPGQGSVTGLAGYPAVAPRGALLYLFLVAVGTGGLPRIHGGTEAVFLQGGRSVVPVDAEAGRDYGLPDQKECGAPGEENQG